MSSLRLVHLNLEARPKRRVLVVDDNLDTVQTMAMLLKSGGHDVEFAINGFAAIDIARRFKPEVIFLDLALPDMRGENLARQLKFEPDLRAVKIYAWTGTDGAEVRQRVIEAGCEDLFVKPVDVSRLEKVLET
jgi:CheY-like chemotaxis protein